MSCVIVVGCYRSGSSAVAGVLQHLGVVMGESFDEPSRNNPKGYWEDLEFKRLHNEFSKGSQPIEEYEALVRQREKAYAQWGVKDPLLCFYLPMLANCLQTDHRAIICRRPLEEISASMGRALNVADEKRFLPLAEHYVKAMEASLAEYQGPRLEVEHGELLADSRVVDRIAKFVSLPLTVEAATYVEAKL